MVSPEELKQLFDENSYRASLFEERGFVRKRCVVCKSYFWTIDPAHQTCGDTTCIGGYRFIGKPAIPEGWNFHEAINDWCDFFKKHGHIKINEYPVVARWRDDIYFNMASIANFQPWVLNGTVPPPADSLCVAQPCLRFGGKGFCDIDNVGKTGRHLSLFIMGGQHSFSNFNWKGYWKDECIELNFEFLVEKLRVGPEEITYKEDVWYGGGNFGPCLESFCRGLEITNNVFMQYEFLENRRKYRESKIKVVDAGWGLERISWLTLGTPTIYEATFGPVLQWAKKQTGISVDKDILYTYSKFSGLLIPDQPSGLEIAEYLATNRIGVDFKELKKEMEPLQALYTILDHSRTLVFALGDGAIPSNVGGGYNLRVLLRRIWSLENLHELDLDLSELCHKHIEYYKKTFRRLTAATNFINDIISVEKDRYITTLTEGNRYVERLISHRMKLNADVFVELYESRGIPPERILELSNRHGVRLKIPDAFYSKMEEKRDKSRKRHPMKQIRKALQFSLEGLPPTKMLFYEKPFETEFYATPLDTIDDGRYLVLDQTLFYPKGGGQEGDTGWINDVRVLNVEKHGDIILHEVRNKIRTFRKGARVKGTINRKRRVALTRHHTATHIVNGATQKILGNHVWQVGSEKSEEKARLDISHYKRVSIDELAKIEFISNKVVMEGRPVHVSWQKRDLAEHEYGFRIYQGGVVPGSEIRIVNIKDWDVEACGGLHVKNTRDVGFIKIINAKRIQDGVVRIELCAGEKALKLLQQQNKLLFEIAQALRTTPKNIFTPFKKLLQMEKELRKEIRNVEKSLVKLCSIKLLEKEEKIGKFSVFTDVFPDVGFKDLIEIGHNIAQERPNCIVLVCGTRKEQEVRVVVVVGRDATKFGLDASVILRKIIGIVKGKGGGSAQLAQGAGVQPDEVYTMLEKAKELVKAFA